MRLPIPRVELPRLVRAERTTHRRATLVASRFELANSGLILLELVCHTRASLDVLESFAETRGLPLDGFVTWCCASSATLLQWIGGLWPRPLAIVYGAIASATFRHVEIAARLRLAALRVHDHELADWSAQWMAERLQLFERLTVSLGLPDTERFSRLSVERVNVKR